MTTEPIPWRWRVSNAFSRWWWDFEFVHRWARRHPAICPHCGDQSSLVYAIGRGVKWRCGLCGRWSVGRWGNLHKLSPADEYAMSNGED